MNVTASVPGKATPSVRSYRDLVVWQRSIQLLAECHRVVKELPAIDRRELGDQLLRAAVSIPANIAEGHGRLSRADYTRHLTVARGSLYELETLLLIAQELDLLPARRTRAAVSLADEVGRMLYALIQKLGTRRLKT